MSVELLSNGTEIYETSNFKMLATFKEPTLKIIPIVTVSRPNITLSVVETVLSSTVCEILPLLRRT